MNYFAAYNQYNPLCVGKLFNTVDEVIEKATITILDYIDDKANDTKSIFGENIESYFRNRIGDKYQFSVYQLSESEGVSYVRTIDLWQIARMSRESQITKGMMSLANEAIRNKVEEKSMLSDYYLTIISNLEQLERVKCSSRARNIITDTYIATIKLSQKTKSKYEVLKYEYVSDINILGIVGNIARGLKSKGDISYYLNLLIWYLWGLAEMAYDIDFVECISEGVNHKIVTRNAN